MQGQITSGRWQSVHPRILHGLFLPVSPPTKLSFLALLPLPLRQAFRLPQPLRLRSFPFLPSAGLSFPESAVFGSGGLPLLPDGFNFSGEEVVDSLEQEEVDEVDEGLLELAISESGEAGTLGRG